MGPFTVTVVAPDGDSFQVFCPGQIECADVIMSEARRSDPMTIFVMHRAGLSGADAVVGRWALNSKGQLVLGKASGRKAGRK